VLTGLRVEKRVEIILEVTREANVSPGRITNVDVIESAVQDGHEEGGPVGGLTLRFISGAD
jgi:hypothetical protein